jgi:hypothetical protein
MGFAHTKPGRPLLALMAGGKRPAVEQIGGGGSGCPLGFSKIDPSQKDAVLKKKADELRGSQRALAKPALGFTFEKTTKADIEAWAKANQVTCHPARFMSDFDCVDVPADLLAREGGGPAVKALKITFDSQERLASLTAIRYDRNPDELVSFYTQRVSTLTQAAGPPSKNEGETSPQYLEAGAPNHASSTFAFNDYYAKTSVRQIREGEFMLVEEYRSLPN